MDQDTFLYFMSTLAQSHAAIFAIFISFVLIIVQSLIGDVREKAQSIVKEYDVLVSPKISAKFQNLVKDNHSTKAMIDNIRNAICQPFDSEEFFQLGISQQWMVYIKKRIDSSIAALDRLEIKLKSLRRAVAWRAGLSFSVLVFVLIVMRFFSKSGSHIPDWTFFSTLLAVIFVDVAKIVFLFQQMKSDYGNRPLQ